MCVVCIGFCIDMKARGNQLECLKCELCATYLLLVDFIAEQ